MQSVSVVLVSLSQSNTIADDWTKVKRRTFFGIILLTCSCYSHGEMILLLAEDSFPARENYGVGLDQGLVFLWLFRNYTVHQIKAQLFVRCCADSAVSSEQAEIMRRGRKWTQLLISCLQTIRHCQWDFVAENCCRSCGAPSSLHYTTSTQRQTLHYGLPAWRVTG